MNVNDVISGAIDMHVHTGPDPFTERRLAAYKIAIEAKQLGMRAVVIKNHNFSTAILAKQVNEIIESSTLIGSIALNREVGGLNPDVVEAAAIAGAKIIWLPTLTSTEEIKTSPAGNILKPGNLIRPKDKGITVINSKGNLVQELNEILEIVNQYNIILATGHIAIPEILSVAKSALKQNIKLIITHPFTKPFGDIINMKQAQELVKKGAIIEFCFLPCMPPMRVSPAETIKYIRKLDAENCIISTDLGQLYNPPPAEGFRMMVSNMIRFGISDTELESLIKINPYKLLNLN